jgi:hypothetical protein
MNSRSRLEEVNLGYASVKMGLVQYHKLAKLSEEVAWK